MQRVLVVSFVLALSGWAHAQPQSFFLRHNDTPIAVPGGASSYILDAAIPTAEVPVAEERVVTASASQSFPTFTSPAFDADVTLLPIASVRLNLSANQKMRECADLGVTLSRVDGSGGLAEIGSGTRAGATLEQGSAGGTVGFASSRLEFPVGDPSILAGQGIAITPTVTNACSLSRRVFFAYDALAAAARVRFQCCFTVAAKCAQAKIKAAAKMASCLLALESRAASSGTVVDPRGAQKCLDRLVKFFGNVDAKKKCVTLGDAPAIAAKVDALVADLTGQLNPLAPPSRSKCQARKIGAASREAVCLLLLGGKAAARGEYLDPDPVNAQKCRNVLATMFGKLESKGTCVTSGDADTIEAQVDAFAGDVTSELACPCP